ncbi:hypothetical protein EVG20_g8920 [Dentipellis fragilis]|uniref:DUF6534 domain-containing protein n=1 Tax=Dentipellis fragilis TaxID=205917 RepID=A0A4Y9Y4E1_9AGAM|nr:hypothetical protein EVG20_g8920 [Dentipellis fragilis]
MASTPPPENPIVLNIATTYGCILIGSWLSSIVWGVSCAQTFLYLSNYWDKDSWTKKGLVIFLWFVDTADEILMVQPLWHVLIVNFGDIEILSQIQPELTHRGWVTALVAFCVQLFFVYRIYVFSGNKWILSAFLVRILKRCASSSPLTVMLQTILSLFQLVVLIPYDVLTWASSHTTSGIQESWATDIIMSLRSVTAAEDIIIAATMIFLVLRNGLPRYRSTRRMVYRLVLVTFMTGFWTAVVGIIELAMVARFPTTLQLLVPDGPLSGLYFSSLLANLNSREFVKGEDFSCWDDSEIEQSKPGSLGATGSGRNRTGGMTFRVWPMESKATGSDGTNDVPLTVKVSTAQVSDSDVREASLDNVRYKAGPEHRLLSTAAPARKEDGASSTSAGSPGFPDRDLESTWKESYPAFCSFHDHLPDCLRPAVPERAPAAAGVLHPRKSEAISESLVVSALDLTETSRYLYCVQHWQALLSAPSLSSLFVPLQFCPPPVVVSDLQATMASVLPPENTYILNLADTYGCMLAGGWLSCIVWGVSCLQTFLYLLKWVTFECRRTFRGSQPPGSYWDKDPWTKKGLVIFLWCVDTANEVLLLEPLWHVLVANFGGIRNVSKIQPALTHHGWVAGIVAFCVQLFFVHRIYEFSRRQWVLPAFLTLLSLFQLIVLIPYDILTLSASHTTTGIEHAWATDITISLRSVTAAEDIIIAASMIILVLKEGLPEFRSTRRMVYRLILVTFNTGFWTAVVAIVELAMVAHFPNGLQFMVLEAPLCSLYFTSLLANLNSREFIKGEHFTSWNDSELSSSGNGRSRVPHSKATSRSTMDEVGLKSGEGMTFRLWPLGSKVMTSNSTNDMTIKVNTTQVSEADVRVESVNEMRYKGEPECGSVLGTALKPGLRLFINPGIADDQQSIKWERRRTLRGRVVLLRSNHPSRKRSHGTAHSVNWQRESLIPTMPHIGANVPPYRRVSPYHSPIYMYSSLVGSITSGSRKFSWLVTELRSLSYSNSLYISGTGCLVLSSSTSHFAYSHKMQLILLSICIVLTALGASAVPVARPRTDAGDAASAALSLANGVLGTTLSNLPVTTGVDGSVGVGLTKRFPDRRPCAPSFPRCPRSSLSIMDLWDLSSAFNRFFRVGIGSIRGINEHPAIVAYSMTSVLNKDDCLQDSLNSSKGGEGNHHGSTNPTPSLPIAYTPHRLRTPTLKELGVCLQDHIHRAPAPRGMLFSRPTPQHRTNIPILTPRKWQLPCSSPFGRSRDATSEARYGALEVPQGGEVVARARRVRWPVEVRA